MLLMLQAKPLLLRYAPLLSLRDYADCARMLRHDFLIALLMLLSLSLSLTLLILPFI